MHQYYDQNVQKEAEPVHAFHADSHPLLVLLEISLRQIDIRSIKKRVKRNTENKRNIHLNVPSDCFLLLQFAPSPCQLPFQLLRLSLNRGKLEQVLFLQN